MGQALQIRVIATTWNPDLLEELWPRLSELAFSIPINHERRGVLEMVRALEDGLQFMPWSEAMRAALKADIQEAGRLKIRMEEMLAQWNAHEANKLSDALESVLDRLERTCATCPQ
ncbi:MAG: hypothetical protein IJU37_03775 [Desulfovibrio sp.]|nr:hypothetical protein [Desulfovibrio sp.]